MRPGSRSLPVVTGFVTILAVLAGLSENLVTGYVPVTWQPAAWVTLLVALGLQLAVSQGRPGWFRSTVYVLLGFPIGVAVNVVAAGLPRNIRPGWTFVLIGAFLLVVLVSAIRNAAIARPRLPTVWSVLVALVWVFFGVASGTVAAVQIIGVINVNGGFTGYQPGAYSHFCLDSLLIPFSGSIFASWVSGKIRSGVFAGILGNVVELVLFAAFPFPGGGGQEFGSVFAAAAFFAFLGVVIGALMGSLGGLLGVGLHRVKWWASADAL